MAGSLSAFEEVVQRVGRGADSGAYLALEMMFSFKLPSAEKAPFQFLITKIIDSFHFSSRILPNMFRDRASILMQAKAKRMPTSATSVAGFGLVSVKQNMDKNKAPL
jgi:hypothetical protein